MEGHRLSCPHEQSSEEGYYRSLIIITILF